VIVETLADMAHVELFNKHRKTTLESPQGTESPSKA
jgi:hypothetical protein